MSGIVEQWVKVQGTPCRLRIAGEGPSGLILFPAVMDSGLAFGRVQLMMRKHLGPGVATVAVDPPGYGTTEETPGFDAWPDFCGALVGELQKLLPGDLVFAGNSSGAVAATESALVTDRARGLIWICWCDWRQREPRSHDLLCPNDEAGLERLLAHAWHHPPKLTEAAKAGMLLSASRNRNHVASFDAEHHRQRLAQYGGPMLVIAGGSDRLVPSEDARAVVAQRQGGIFQDIEGSGHYPHREQPAALAASLSEFTSKCFARAAPRMEQATEGEHAVHADQ